MNNLREEGVSQPHVYCCGCTKHVTPRLTTGKEIYPHRKDLQHLSFWVCDKCTNYVGCHRKSKNVPLGTIPTPYVRSLRSELHNIIDEVWSTLKICRRGRIYSLISKHLGYAYHTANVNNKKEFDNVLSAFELALDEI